jgi:hypothetical protein
MDQDKFLQKHFVKSDGRSFIHELMDPGFETAVRKCRTRDFIFGEAQENNSRRDASRSDGFRSDCSRTVYYFCAGGKMANTRAGPPEPPSSLIGAAIRNAPASGN